MSDQKLITIEDFNQIVKDNLPERFIILTPYPNAYCPLCRGISQCHAYEMFHGACKQRTNPKPAEKA